MVNKQDLSGEKDGQVSFRLSRRVLLSGLGGLAGCAVLRGDSDTTSYYLPRGEHHETVPVAPRQPELDLPVHVDKLYLDELRSRLQERKPDTPRRVAAVRNALRVVENENSSGEVFVGGTAFQIDRSGIYLTAGHVAKHHDSPVLGPFHLAVTNPSTGETSHVKAAIKHPTADLALLFAPTGLSPQATHDLEIGPRAQVPGEALWLMGFYPDMDSSLCTTIRTGHVDPRVQLPTIRYETNRGEEIIQEAGSRVAVRGLIPFGGTSGSPIVDQQGVIVGIEQGAYPVANHVSDYEGAIITPLTYLDDLVHQPVLRY